jgi:hypothetical protein
LTRYIKALVDWFGTDFRIIEKDEDSICIRVTCNQDALRYWALQYGPYIEVVEPKYEGSESDE